MSNPEDQALVLASPMQASPQSSTTTAAERPFTYNNGYGDFCFLRLVDGYPKPPAGVVDPEFIRQGTFPFMKLPREIRDEIYKLVLAPLLCKHGFNKGQSRDLVLHVRNFKDEDYSIKAYKIWKLLHHPGFRKRIDSYPQLRATFEEEEMEVNALNTRHLHPARAKYEITFPLNWAGEVSLQDVEKTPPVLLASVRNLSNVSCQIRQELAICTWARSLLILDMGFEDNFVANKFLEVIRCLQERPAIWKGLKTLLLSVPIYECDSTEVISLLEFVEQHLQLDLFILKLEYCESESIEDLLEHHLKHSWVQTLRDLRCTKNFHLMIEYADEWDSPHARAAELKTLLTPLILAGHKGELQIAAPEELALSSITCVGFAYRLQPDGSFKYVSRSERCKSLTKYEFEKFWKDAPLEEWYQPDSEQEDDEDLL